ncbi:hypothetical protein [Rhodococcus sp. NPDC003348]
MRRGGWAGERQLLGEVADSGIIRVSTLVSFGVSSSTITSRCGPDGSWRRILPGVIQLTNGHPTHRQRLVAGLAYCGDGAVLTGRTALREYGFGTEAGDVHVLLPDRRRVQSTAFVRVERTTRLPQPVIRGGLPCAPLPRALLDAARRCTTLNSTRALIAAVVQRKAVTAVELAVELAEGSIRGSAFARVVLEEMNANVHSVPEALARQIWQSTGLPEMVFNRTIRSEDGTFLAQPDGWIDCVGLAWEIDSIDWHTAPESYAATTARRTRMQNAGIVVLSTLPRTVRDDPETVRDALRAHHALAASRPRPPVVLDSVAPGRP